MVWRDIEGWPERVADVAEIPPGLPSLTTWMSVSGLGDTLASEVRGAADTGTARRSAPIATRIARPMASSTIPGGTALRGERVGDLANQVVEVQRRRRFAGCHGPQRSDVPHREARDRALDGAPAGDG